VAQIKIPNEPKTYKDVVASLENEHWLATMQEEYKSFVKNNTWTLEEILEEANLVKCRWVFKTQVSNKWFC